MGTDKRSSARKRIPSGFRSIRDAISFTLGAAILSHEVFVAASADPAAVAVSAALLGLPIALGIDERKKGK